MQIVDFGDKGKFRLSKDVLDTGETIIVRAHGLDGVYKVDRPIIASTEDRGVLKPTVVKTNAASSALPKWLTNKIIDSCDILSAARYAIVCDGKVLPVSARLNQTFPQDPNIGWRFDIGGAQYAITESVAVLGTNYSGLEVIFRFYLVSYIEGLRATESVPLDPGAESDAEPEPETDAEKLVSENTKEGLLAIAESYGVYDETFENKKKADIAEAIVAASKNS